MLDSGDIQPLLSEVLDREEFERIPLTDHTVDTTSQAASFDKYS